VHERGRAGRVAKQVEGCGRQPGEAGHQGRVSAGYSTTGSKTSTGKFTEGYHKSGKNSWYKTEFNTAQYRGTCAIYRHVMAWKGLRQCASVAARPSAGKQIEHVSASWSLACVWGGSAATGDRIA
jgi:hypothetical protein